MQHNTIVTLIGAIGVLAERHGTTLRAAALAFCAAPAAVASVLVGARSAAEIEDGARQFATPVPAAFWQELRAAHLLPADVTLPTEDPS